MHKKIKEIEHLKKNVFFIFKKNLFFQIDLKKMLNNFSKIYFLRKESEQFLNNVEQKIILCKMLEIVYAENSEQFL